MYHAGSGHSEGYNSQLSQVLPKVHLKINKMVDFLAKEDKYWVDMFNNPKLWDKRKRKTENDKAAYERTQAKKARLTATEYMVGSNKGAGGQCESQSTTTTTTTTSTTTTSNQAVDLNDCKDEENDIIDLVDPRSLCSPPLSPNSVIRGILARTPHAEQSMYTHKTILFFI
jgi:hypothetical protein